jgi:hypothetical protein
VFGVASGSGPLDSPPAPNGRGHDAAFKALLQSGPDPVTADKISDLRNIFRDVYTGWLEIYQEAA